MKRHYKFLLASVLCQSMLTHADDTWTGAVDGNWNTAGNWLDGSVPANSQALGNMIFLTNPGAGNLTMTNNRTSGDSVYGVTMNANATGPIVIGGNALGMGAGGIDLSASSFDLTFNNIVNVNAGGGVWTVPAGRVLTFNDVNNGNGVTTAGAGTIRLSGGAGTDNGSFAITVGGTTTLELDKTSAADRAIGNSLTVNNGALAILTGTSNGQLWNNADLTVNAGGILEMNGKSEGADGLSGAGTIRNNSATAVTLSLGTNDSTGGNFTGSILQPSSGVVSLDIRNHPANGGTGTGVAYLNPSSPANYTFTGPVTVSTGILRVNANAVSAINANGSRFILNGGVMETDTTTASLGLTLGTGAGQLAWGATSSGGFSASGANANITLNGGAGLTWGQTNFIQNNQNLGLGSSPRGTGGFTATLTNPLDLGGTTNATNGSLRGLQATGSTANIEGALSGVVSGAAGINKNNIGTINLAGTANSYAGGTYVTGGALAYTGSAGINAAVAGGLEAYVVPTASTQVAGNGNNSSVAYSGAGSHTADFFSSIADHNFPVSVTLTGTNANGINFGLAPAGIRDALYLGAPAGNNLVQNGVITPANATYRLGGGSGNLRLDSANDLTGANSLVVRDGGVVTVDNAAQNMTGAVTVNGGIFELRGNGASLAGSADIVVNGLGGHGYALTGNWINGYNGPSATVWSNTKGGGLVLIGKNDASGASLASRSVVLNGGLITARPDAANNNIQAPSVELASGYSMIAHTPNGNGSGYFLIGNLTRDTPGATVEFRSHFGNLGSAATGDFGKIRLTNINGAAAANVNGIIGGWTLATNGGTSGTTGSATPSRFAEWDATAGVRPFTNYGATTAPAAWAGGALSGQNWLVNAASTLSADTTLNSLVVERGLTLNNNVDIVVESGGVILAGTSTGSAYGISNGSGLASLTSAYNSGAPSAPNELFLYAANQGGDTRISSVNLVDNGGTPVSVIKGGPGQIIYNGNATYTGGTVVNEGTYQLDFRSARTPLTASTGPVTVRSGGILSFGLDNAAGVTVSNNITLDGGVLRNDNTGGGTGNTLTLTGTVTIGGLAGAASYLDASNNRGIVFGPAATLTGAGNLSRINSAGTAGLIDIQTANTSGFTGNVIITAGTTQVSGAGVLPNVDYYLSGGTLGVTSTTASTLRSLAGTGGTISGNVGGSDSFTVNQGIDTAFHGVITETRLIKEGTGHLLITGPGHNGTAAMTVNDGTLTLGKISNRDIHALGGTTASQLVVGGGTAKLGGSFTASGAGGNAPPLFFNAAGVSINLESVSGYTDQFHLDAGVTLNSGTFDLNGRSEALDELAGTGGQVTNSQLTPSTLMVGQGNASASYAGTITDGIGQVSLVKVGTGTQTLTGVNGHTGKTTVAGGTLAVSSGNEASLGANPASPVSDQLTLSGGTLSITGASLTINDVNRGVAVSLSGGTFAVDTGLSLNLDNVLTAAAAGSTLFKAGAGTFNLSANATINALDVVGGNFRQNSGTTQILTSTTGLKVRNGGTYVLSGGTLRTDRINIESGGSFEWGGGTIAHLTTNSSAGGTDYSSPTYHAVQAGANLEITGSLTSTSGSVLALHASPTLYLNAGVRFNTVSVDGNLNLLNAGDTLEFELNPYYLRPFSSAGISAIETGSLPFITWTGAWDGGFFDNVTGIITTSNFQEYTGGPITDPNSLPTDTWQLEYDAAAQTIWFHYKVSGYVPEPGSFGLLAAGTLGLRLMRTLRSQRRRIDPAV